MRFFVLAGCLLVTHAYAETFVDLGFSTMDITSRFAGRADTVDRSESGAHVGIGARRELAHGAVGVRLELDNVGSDLLLAVRALDYRRHLSERLALSGFIGAARFDLATPAYGFYGGGGVQLRNVLRNWDVGVDVRIAKRVARDNLLPNDPQGPSPDNFHDISGLSVYFSRAF
jgi:hypothetical protein